jgi:outer membrane biosynthesis protein TonB
MTKRRSLSEGIKVANEKEEEFIYGPKRKPAAKQDLTEEQSKKTKAPSKKTVTENKPQKQEEETPPVAEAAVAQPASLARLTSRVRPDLANALKEASLKRQLAKEKPNTIQDILEEALEPWLKSHGYLP